MTMNAIWQWLVANGLDVLGWWCLASLVVGALWSVAFRRKEDPRPTWED